MVTPCLSPPSEFILLKGAAFSCYLSLIFFYSLEVTTSPSALKPKARPTAHAQTVPGL